MAWQLPSIIHAAPGRPSPSNRITMGFIGVGWMGTGNLTAFLTKDDVQVVAVCDVDSNHRANAKRLVDERYRNAGCVEYVDFREMLARGDLDAVCVSTPDHWHGICGVAALKAGCDVYGEKPLTRFLADGRAICDTASRYGRVWQTGSVLRSREHFHRACELVRNGRIGRIQRVQVVLPEGHVDLDNTQDKTAFTSPPPELDYDRWLGPAPPAPYCPARVHKNWRWILDYGGGMLMDFIGHHGDIALWGLGREYTGPVSVEAWCDQPTGLWNSPQKFRASFLYADGLPLELTSTGRPGTTWFGETGQVFVTHEAIEVQPDSLRFEVIEPNETRLVRSLDHYQNFLDAVRARGGAVAPCEASHRAASLGHIAMISMRLGRKLQWDPQKELFPGDDEANRMLVRSNSSPWYL